MLQFEPRSRYEGFLKSRMLGQGQLSQFWERRVLKVLQGRSVAEFKNRLASCGPGDILLDLGANVGKFTRIMAKTGAEVHAYEPDPATFEWLQKNCRDYSNIVFHNKAVGAAPGSVSLRRHKNYWRGKKAASVASTVVFSDPDGYEQNTIPVEQVGFRDVLAGLRKPASIVKMDIEGAEFSILDDLFTKRNFAGFDALFVETHERVDTRLIADVMRWREEAKQLSEPHICLYWP